MKEWRNILVKPDITIEDAIKVLDREALRLVIVVDKNQRILGTLTDGDVRRALLRHLSLSVSVRNVMNTEPKTVREDCRREHILAKMEEHQLLQIPIVNAAGQIVGLETLHDLFQKKRHDNPVCLMAGGFGTRLRPLTDNCPKPLLKIGNKPILEIILENFVYSGFYNFFISTHYMPDRIRNYFEDGSRWGVNIRYVHEDMPLGTGGALGLLPQNEIIKPLIVMNGDLLTNLDFHRLLTFHDEHTGVATVCVREYEYQVPYGVIHSNGSEIQSIVEKPVNRCFINAGIYILSPDLVKSVQMKKYLDMTTLIEQQICNGNKVNMFPIHEYWLDIGRMEDYNIAQQYYSI